MLISARMAADTRAALRRRHDATTPRPHDADQRDRFDDLDSRPWGRHRAEAELDFALDDLKDTHALSDSAEERESVEQRVRRTWQSYDLGAVDEVIGLVYQAVAEGRTGEASAGATLKQ